MTPEPVSGESVPAKTMTPKVHNQHAQDLLLTLAKGPYYATVNGFKKVESRTEGRRISYRGRKMGYSWIRSLMLDHNGDPRKYRNIVYSHGPYVGGDLPCVTVRFDGLSWNNEPGSFMVGANRVGSPDGHWEIYNGPVLSVVR